ncbi:SDR family NAD(P)-dependent oxidoreductase [Ramlibacter rhizophilus]|uniref:SDR family oxidoreductase n=1 Tax=Ramlibacter rhizophilus TaxID=1781167 RepID=A0A4Z0C1W3_9BURK|nr:SDR family oxidoreductase [Ramlibacter rhizophilus]TFZ04498.1 SDR family oxidoreductase [Ramlibacter rhizophilus]
MEHRPLEGRTAVVTGGSSGIGAACVRLLAAQGANVVVGYYSGEGRAQQLVAELAGTGHMAMCIPLEDSQAHADAARRLAERFGAVHVLVNSAGYTRRIAHADFDALTPELFNSLLVANAGGPYAITRALLPLLRASGDAVVVNVSSVSAFTGAGSNIAYCAAKAALDTMTQAMARACGPAVRLLCVSPASVDTEFVEGRSRAELEKKATQTPLGRVVTPDDVACAVLACVTHLRTATGTRIVIDGGHTL